MEQVENSVSQHRRLQYDYFVLSKIKILYRLNKTGFPFVMLCEHNS